MPGLLALQLAGWVVKWNSWAVPPSLQVHAAPLAYYLWLAIMRSFSCCYSSGLTVNFISRFIAPFPCTQLSGRHGRCSRGRSKKPSGQASPVRQLEGKRCFFEGQMVHQGGEGAVRSEWWRISVFRSMKNTPGSQPHTTEKDEKASYHPMFGISYLVTRCPQVCPYSPEAVCAKGSPKRLAR